MRKRCVFHYKIQENQCNFQAPAVRLKAQLHLFSDFAVSIVLCVPDSGFADCIITAHIYYMETKIALSELFTPL